MALNFSKTSVFFVHSTHPKFHVIDRMRIVRMMEFTAMNPEIEDFVGKILDNETIAENARKMNAENAEKLKRMGISIPTMASVSVKTETPVMVDPEPNWGFARKYEKIQGRKSYVQTVLNQLVAHGCWKSYFVTVHLINGGKVLIEYTDAGKVYLPGSHSTTKTTLEKFAKALYNGRY